MWGFSVHRTGERGSRCAHPRFQHTFATGRNGTGKQDPHTRGSVVVGRDLVVLVPVPAAEGAIEDPGRVAAGNEACDPREDDERSEGCMRAIGSGRGGSRSRR